MEEFTRISNYAFEKKPDKKIVDQLIEKLLKGNNIVDINTDERSISIEYYQQMISANQIQTLIENSGIELRHEDIEVLSYEKNPFKRFISRMAASNEKNFGNKRLDCCDLNETPKPKS